jgi:CO dehydrogenase nickel-insertion accessory protein CooC1
METAARCKVMAEELGILRILAVPNKVRGPRDAEAMRSFFAHVGLPFTVFIPADEMILEADRLGRAPLDHDAASPAVEEIARLADALCGT